MTHLRSVIAIGAKQSSAVGVATSPLDLHPWAGLFRRSASRNDDRRPTLTSNRQNHSDEALARRDGGLQLVSKALDFAESGTSGDPGDISATSVGGDDGMAIESGGRFGGHTIMAVHFYAPPELKRETE